MEIFLFEIKTNSCFYHNCYIINNVNFGYTFSKT